MPTTVTKSIGTNGRDYSTLQAWEDACPSDLTAVDQIWKGECYNDSEFTAGLAISGMTTDSTRYVWLTAAAGQSFQDHASVRTNALKYDQSKGVGIAAGVAYTYMFSVSGSINAVISRLQIKATAVYAGLGVSLSSNTLFKDCVVLGENDNYLLDLNNSLGGTTAAVNCLVINNQAATTQTTAVRGRFINCTVVRPSNFTAGGTAFGRDYGLSIKNCAVFGFTTFRNGTGASYYTGSYNASDCAADAQDTNSTGGLTFANVFENTTNDFRLKAGAPLIGVGNTDATNAPSDISGRVRDAGTAGDVGAWEWSDPTLFGQLDETTASNTDYITTSTAGSVAEMQLGSVTDPGVDTLHSIKLRASGSGSLQVDLVQGSGALLTIWTSKTRTQQPRSGTSANLRHPVLRGLSFLWSAAQDKAEVTRGVTPSGYWTTPILVNPTPFGLAGRNAATAATRFDATKFPASTQYTYLAFVLDDAGRGTTRNFFDSDDGGSARIFQFRCTSSNTVEFIAFNTGGGNSSEFTTSATTSSTAPQVIAARSNGDGSLDLFIDGAGKTTALILLGTTVRTNSEAGAKYSIGGAVYGAAPFPGGVFWAAAWSRALSDAEIQYVSAHPWQLFAPERTPRHIPAAKPIASRTIPLIATPTDYRRELLPAEAALITNYADLRVRFRGV